MTGIKNAKFRGVVERNDRRYAQVEVTTEGPDAKEMLVHFCKSADQGLEMPLIVANHADYDLDWSENPMHQAYEDVSQSMFSNQAGPSEWGSKEEFKRNVLNYGTLKLEIESHLP